MMKKTLFLSLMLSFLLTKAQVAPLTQICLVTVDTNSTHNIIVWEKASQQSNLPIDSIKIYRTALLGTDTLVGVVPWSSLSQFSDYSADPNLRSHRYRISGVNSAGVEGPMSLPHKTIHFTLVEQGDSIKLLWTPYIGAPFSVYNCLIDSAGSPAGWEWVNSTANNIDTSWWDKNTPADWTNLDYLVNAGGMTNCSATKAVDHNTTRSNRATAVAPNATSIFEEEGIQEIALFPNPASESTRLVFSSLNWSPIQLFITDNLGRKIKEYSTIKVLGQYSLDIDLSQFEKGMYHIVILENNTLYSKSLLKL